MPLDLRTTIFSEDEVVDALLEYTKRNHIDLPPTGVDTLALEWEPKLCATLTFKADALDRTDSLTFDANEVAAAVILYCHRFKEPVPHFAEKGLKPYDGGGLELLLRFPWGDQWSAKHTAFHVTFPTMAGEDDTPYEG